MKSLSIGEAVEFGWGVAKKNIGFFLPVFAGYFIVMIFLNLLGDHSVLATLISWALNLLFSLGLIRVALMFVDGRKATFDDLFSPFSWELILNYFIGVVLYVLLVILGLIFFIIPGIYFAVTYSFYSYFIVDKNADPLNALSLSSKATQGVKMDLLALWIILGLINFVGLLAFFIGLFWTLPTTMVASAYVYRKLSEKKINKLR